MSFADCKLQLHLQLQLADVDELVSLFVPTVRQVRRMNHSLGDLLDPVLPLESGKAAECP